jgi:RNA-binding protein NOB1
LQAIVSFSRQTGDYQSLSTVDLQVLALAYELEQQAAPNMEHIRKTPKRVVGIGKVEKLAKDEEKKDKAGEASSSSDDESDDESVDTDDEPTPSVTSPAGTTEPIPPLSAPVVPPRPRSWAALVNPSAGTVAPVVLPVAGVSISNQAATTAFGSMSISNTARRVDDGQFSDAEESEQLEPKPLKQAEEDELEKELKSDFPSLSASLLVPYDGSDNEVEELDNEMRKKQSLAPITKSGKLYNTLGKYKKLAVNKPVISDTKTSNTLPESEDDTTAQNLAQPETASAKPTQSRILGGSTLGGQEVEFEDDGEGWISTVTEIQKMKSMGVLDPRNNPDSTAVPRPNEGPPISQRAACATTDFAMQNVLLQMNMELLSVDGVKVRKLKSWVQRCGACFKVFTNTENTGPVAGKRLFCDHCGSSMIQRIACSVDKKSGRLRLHLSKKYKHNLRGTKFSLPKPGTNNRFQGDLVLAEDQLMTGVWNQKVKIRSGGKAKTSAESMFGLDIASNVGCNTRSMTEDDIRVGFGRRNPNAARGRERRGKKKKSGNKACGLRRY